MNTYLYRALNENDTIIEGTLNAANEQEAQMRLNRTCKSIIELKEKSQSSRIASAAFRKTPRVKFESLAVYTRQLAVLVNAGIAINRSLRFLAKGEDGNLNLVMDRVADMVEEGKSMSAAMAEQPRVFNNIYTALVAAGEHSGGLDITLRKLADLLEKTVKLRKRVVSTFTYPGVIGLVATAIIGLFVFYIFPEMLPIFTSLNVQLPWPTRFLIFVTENATNPKILTPVLVFLGVGSWAVYSWLVGLDENGEIRYHLDRWLLSVPVIGELLKQSSAARVLYTIGTLLDSGVSLTDTLMTVEKVAGNAVLARRLMWARKELLDGANLSQACERHEVFQDIALQMIKVGEETGRLGDMVIRVAQLYEEDVDYQLDRLASLMEPLMMAVMGVSVGFVTIASFLPMISLLNSM